MEKRQKMDEGTGIDRISELPEPILHHIQSLLFVEEAARTSALSKAWNTVWSTLPYLNFHDTYFYTYFRGDTGTTNQKLSAFIGETLNHRTRQGIRIHKFGLSTMDVYYNKFDLYKHLDSWIDCLKVCKIEEIMIEVGHSNYPFVLPPNLFTIESLTTLRLVSCKLPCPAIEHIKLLNLRKLCLEYVHIDDQLLHHIFSICLSLEYLKIQICGIMRLRISGLLNLKIIITEYVEDVEVEASSNLQELSLSHLRLPPKINTAYCGNTLKCLKLTSVSVKDDVWFSRLIPNLQVLETLSLEGVNYNALRISSLSLKHLNLCRPKMVFEAEIDTPNLQKFRYVGELLNFSLKHNLATGHVELELWGSRIDEDWLIKLIQLLRKFDHSKVVKLSIPYLEVSKEMREKLLAPLPNVKHFICCCNIPRSTPLSDAVTHVLDGSLWMSSCLKDLVISMDEIEIYDSDYCQRPSYDEGFIISLKLMYENPLKENIKENESCFHCESIPFRCWRHSLKTVEIEKTGECARVDDAMQSVKNYFMANLHSRSECHVSKLFTERKFMEKRRKMDEGTGIDRISELPEPILHHIQSLLFVEEAARTSALSKAWNTVWSTLPYLNFDDTYSRSQYKYSPAEYDTMFQKLSDFIGKTLNQRRRQGIRIQKFRLFIKDVCGHLDSWIDCLKACKIDKLMIELRYPSDLSVVPPSLFTIESLTTLRLDSCKLPCPAIEDIKLLNLRKLYLNYVDVDDQLLHHIFSICLSLEYLKVRSHRIQRLRISGLPNLKIIITGYVEDVEVEASSNLQELSLSHLGLPPKINPAYCGNTLKCLKLTSVSFKDDVWFGRLIPKLQVLETLSLEEVNVNSNALRISSLSLKHLNLCRPKMVFEAEIDTPNLQKFRYVGELLNFSLKHNLAIGHVELELWGSRSCGTDGDWLIKLIQLLQKFNHSKVVKLTIPYLEMSKEMREKLLAPLPDVKHLFIYSHSIPRSTPLNDELPLNDALTQVLDVSLWMSSCLKDLVMSVDEIEYWEYEWSDRPSYYDEGFIISLKLMYEKEHKEDIEENESCCQCDSIPLRCWRHSLKTVEIVRKGWSARIDDAVQSVKNYFMANLSSRSECDVSKLFTERWVSYDPFRPN